MSTRIRILAVVLLVLAAGVSLAADGPTVKVDGKILETSPAAVIRDGVTYVPITAFRKMGLFVDWKPGQKTGTIAWQDSDLIYTVIAGQSWVVGQIMGSRLDLPGAPFMSGDQLMVPLRTPVIDTPESRAFQIRWDAETRTAHVCRSEGWLNLRLKDDAALKTASPGCYETPM